MSIFADLTDMRWALVQELLDKQAISEVIYKYCRAMDRMDRRLAMSCWHPDGTGDYGTLFSGLGSEFVDWVWPVHANMERTQHNVQNILIEVRGDEASSEAYWLVYLRVAQKDGLMDIVGGGRYIDLWERRDEGWKIKHRKVVFDWDRLEKVTPHFGETPQVPQSNPGGVTLRGLRSRDDYSYKVGLPTKSGG